MNWNSTNSTWEVTIHTFIEDLEYAISKSNNTRYVFDKNNPSPINEYIEQHFAIDDAKGGAYEFIGMEDDGHDLFIHFEYKKKDNPQDISIKNTMLIRFFDDQQNMHHISINGKKHTAYLNADNYITKIKFNE